MAWAMGSGAICERRCGVWALSMAEQARVQPLGQGTAALGGPRNKRGKLTHPHAKVQRWVKVQPRWVAREANKES